jgi:fructose/tagatose bisphosphate aldolase
VRPAPASIIPEELRHHVAGLAAGRPNLFNSHMFDGSALSLKENLDDRHGP